MGVSNNKYRYKLIPLGGKTMKKSLILICLLSLCIGIYGCSTPSRELTEEGIVFYNTENSIDPLNYTLYANKEISLTLNLLEGHMTNGRYVIKDKYPIVDEIDNVTESLDMIDEAIFSVETLNPPNEYEDDRDYILRRMANIRDTLEAYKGALLENNFEDIEKCIDVMAGDFTALKSMFNNMWE